MNRLHFIIFSIIIFLTSGSQNLLANTAVNNGEISGLVKDAFDMPAMFAAVQLTGKQGNKFTTTDTNGVFYLFSVAPGNYTLMVIYMADTVQKDIYMSPGQTLQTNITVEPFYTLETSVIKPKDYEAMVIIDPFDPMKIDLGKESLKLGTENSLEGHLDRLPGVAITPDGFSIRGARPTSTSYEIDGVRVFGSPHVPLGAVEYLRVYTGGLPAKYGDTAGGLITIETRSYFTE